jgi:hypothetical protein
LQVWEKKTYFKGTTVCGPLVNFINVKRTNFLYERHISAAFSSYMYVEKRCSYEKFVHKMLMKLTPRVNFTIIFARLFRANKLRSFFGNRRMANGTKIWQLAYIFCKFSLTNLAWLCGEFGLSLGQNVGEIE